MKTVVALILIVFSQTTMAADTVEIFDFSSCQVKTEKILGRTAGIPAHRLGEVLAEILDPNSIDDIIMDSACAAQFQEIQKQKAAQDDGVRVLYVEGLNGEDGEIVFASVYDPMWQTAISMQTMFM